MASLRLPSFSCLYTMVGLLPLVAATSCSNSDSIGALRSGGSGGLGTSSGGASGQQDSSAGGSPGNGGTSGTVAAGGTSSQGGVSGSGGLVASGGSGGRGQADAAPADALSSVDGSALANLCLTTGGQVGSGLCCTSVSEFPGTCSVGACGCAPSSSHTIPTCTCPGASCFSQTAGCIFSGGQGTGGAGGNDARALDVPASTDATGLSSLCTSTGGQVSSASCCASSSDFPNMCLVGACGCSPSSSHTVAVCTCPSNSCFVPTVGCSPYTASTDAATQVDGNGCTARPEGDATYCGGTKPAHYYTCTLTMLTDPCATVSIGNVTNAFCCP